MSSNNANRIYSFAKLKGGNPYTITVDFSDTNFPTYLYFGYYINGVATRLTYITTDTVSKHSFSFNAIEGATYCLRMGDTISESAFLNQVGKINDIQIEVGSTATEYEEFQGDAISVSWETEAGTIYHGSFTLNEDGSVDVISDKAYALLNDPDLWEELGSSSTTPFRYNKSFNDRKLYNNSYTGLICSYYKVDPNAQANTARWSGAISYIFGFKSPSLTFEQIKTDSAAGKIAICYDLDTPQTYHFDNIGQLTTFIGTNNVWTDTGDVTVTYDSTASRFSFGSPLHTYNHANLKLFGNTYIEHGKG